MGTLNEKPGLRYCKMNTFWFSRDAELLSQGVGWDLGFSENALLANISGFGALPSFPSASTCHSFFSYEGTLWLVMNYGECESAGDQKQNQRNTIAVSMVLKEQP